MAKEATSEPLLPSPNDSIVTEPSLAPSSPSFRSPTHRRTTWLLRIYISLQAASIIFTFACINYRDWFRYCWFQFGVQSADNIAVVESTFKQNIDYLRYLICDQGPEFRSTANLYCPEFCDNLENLVHAGGVMLFFMLYSVMLGTIATVLHFVKLFNRAYHADLMKALVLSPALSFLLGAIIYLSVANFAAYKSTNNADLCPADRTVDFKLSTGALMWLLNFLLQVGTSAFGFFCTVREFRKS